MSITLRRRTMARNLDRTLVVTTYGLKVLARTPLSKVEGLLLWHLVESLPVTGETVQKAALFEKLSVSIAQGERSMKRLCELGFLVRGPKIGVSHHYKLNPAFIRILS